MAIRLIVLDVDGCLTDGRIVYSAEGDELKAFDVKDGLAIASWIRLGRQAAIITGRHSKIVERRAAELGIAHCYQGVKEKRKVLASLLEKLGLTYAQVATIGDDLNDYTMLQDAAISFVPRDAVAAVEKVATVTLSKRGGEGAVREMIEYLITKEGLTDEWLRIWSVA